MKFKTVLPWVAVAAALVLLFWMTSSKPDSYRKPTGPVAACVAVGTQCRMGGSKLGVCATAVGGGLTCMSQH